MSEWKSIVCDDCGDEIEVSGGFKTLCDCDAVFMP